MAYFANGTEAMMYEDKYCDKCVHNHPDYGCPCLIAHMLWNYDECNNADSILHKMIPVRKDAFADRCTFFVPLDGKEGE